MAKYVIKREWEAVKEGWPHPWLMPDELGEYDSEYTYAIYKMDDDGKPIEWIGSDGGEPEDQTLSRDWAWVASALERAWNDGYNQRINDPT